jgi:hypothetical protein
MTSWTKRKNIGMPEVTKLVIRNSAGEREREGGARWSAQLLAILLVLDGCCGRKGYLHPFIRRHHLQTSRGGVGRGKAIAEDERTAVSGFR